MDQTSLFLMELHSSLCRCGQSNRKSYCDGTHRRIGYKAKAEEVKAPEVEDQEHRKERKKMNSDFNDELKILTTLKKWGVLSEKGISNLSKLSHRRCNLTLDRLEQDRLVKQVKSREFAKAYRITGSGLDHLDNVEKRSVMR